MFPKFCFIKIGHILNTTAQGGSQFGTLILECAEHYSDSKRMIHVLLEIRFIHQMVQRNKKKSKLDFQRVEHQYHSLGRIPQILRPISQMLLVGVGQSDLGKTQLMRHSLSLAA
jgi:hypothetical protein